MLVVLSTKSLFIHVQTWHKRTFCLVGLDTELNFSTTKGYELWHLQTPIVVNINCLRHFPGIFARIRVYFSRKKVKTQRSHVKLFPLMATHQANEFLLFASIICSFSYLHRTFTFSLLAIFSGKHFRDTPSSDENPNYASSQWYFNNSGRKIRKIAQQKQNLFETNRMSAATCYMHPGQFHLRQFQFKTLPIYFVKHRTFLNRWEGPVLAT